MLKSSTCVLVVGGYRVNVISIVASLLCSAVPLPTVLVFVSDSRCAVAGTGEIAGRFLFTRVRTVRLCQNDPTQGAPC